ncbi:MAG: gluconokinase [Bacteroidota bacterium]
MSDSGKHAPVIVIFGVSGCGKTTIANVVSERLSIPYYDADDFHPASNIEKMRNGIALTDTDRLPWLQAMAHQITLWENSGGAVLACSALKEKYRKLLASKATQPIQWVLLSGTFELIKSRIKARKDHFMSTTLLQSQFDTLEIPDYGLNISIEKTPKAIANTIITKLNKYE